MHSSLCLHPAKISWALGNANSNIDKHLVSEFREFYWTWVWRALTLQFAKESLDCQFQWENSFQQITRLRLVQSLCNFCIKRIAHLGHFWPKCASFFKKEFFRLRENLETCRDWSAPPEAHLNQKITLAHTNNLKFINPDKKRIIWKTQIKYFYLGFKRNISKCFKNPDEKNLSGKSRQKNFIWPR